MRKNILILLILLLVSCRTSNIKTTPEIIAVENETFQLHYNSIDEAESQQIAGWLDQGQEKLEEFFNEGFKNNFDVYIFSSRDSLDSQWQKDWNMPNFRSQCWMVASGIGHRLDILSPRTWNTQACEHDKNDTIATKQLIIHELVHVFHGQNNPSPTFENIENIDWFVEGLAVYVSGQLDEERLKAAKSEVIEKGVPNKLANIWKGKNKYGFSGSIVGFIDKKYGKDILKELITYTRATEILDALNISEEKLIKEWANSLY